jgi:4-alpha-glucanotransferase
VAGAAVGSSQLWRFAVPLQDVLNLGKDARMNQPGSAQGNWRWRCTEDMLSPSAWESSLRDLTQASARPGGLETPRDLLALLSPEVTR